MADGEPPFTGLSESDADEPESQHTPPSSTSAAVNRLLAQIVESSSDEEVEDPRAELVDRFLDLTMADFRSRCRLVARQTASNQDAIREFVIEYSYQLLDAMVTRVPGAQLPPIVLPQGQGEMFRDNPMNIDEMFHGEERAEVLRQFIDAFREDLIEYHALRVADLQLPNNDHDTPPQPGEENLGDEDDSDSDSDSFFPELQEQLAEYLRRRIADPDAGDPEVGVDSSDSGAGGDDQAEHAASQEETSAAEEEEDSDD